MNEETTRHPLAPRPVLLAVLATLGSAAAVAQSADANALPTVTVTSDWLGAPSQAAARRHPGARTVLGEAELNESGSRTIEDALRQVPGLAVADESGTGVLPNIGVRGLLPLRSEQVLLLQDGIPMTLAPYGQTGASLFPLTLQSVQAVDVARGGVAVHYGPNNVGGVINFVTRRIPMERTASAKESVSVAKSGRVLTDSYARVGGYVGERLGLQLQANAIEGEGERDHSRTSVRNVMLDGEWYPTDRTDLKAGLQHYTTRNELPGALTPASYARDREQSTRPLDRFDGETTRAHLIYTHRFAGGAQLQWKNFGHRSERIFAFGNAASADAASTLRQSSPRDFRVYGTEPSLSFDLAGPVRQKLMAGLRYMREEVDYKVDAVNQATGAYSVARDWRFENDAYAAYVSDTFLLLDGRLKITPGVRHEDVRLSYRNNASGVRTHDTTRDWLPGLDIGWQATGELFLFANAHRSLRPVQFTQITFGGDLAAERARNYEAGVRWAATPQLDLGLAAFRFQFDNKLEFVSASAGFRNLGQARHQGAELEAKWRPLALRGLELGASYTHLDTEQQSGAFAGKELPYAPRRQAGVQATYRSNGWTWNLNGQHQSAMFSDGANTLAENATGSAGRIPSFVVWNAHAGYAFTWHGTRMKAGVGVNNLLDRDYWFRGVDYSQGRMPQPGRALLVNLQVDL